MSKWMPNSIKALNSFLKSAEPINFTKSLLHRIKSLSAFSKPRKISMQVAEKLNHQHLQFAEHQISFVAKLSDTDHLRRTVDNILIPRVVGTPGHDKVRDFIIGSMEEFKWTVTMDSFKNATPNMGELQFENIIATLNPNAERFLVLACHYDSKYFPNEEFLGATDSAVPCAMLINLAHTLKESLDTIRKSNELSLMYVFFDGEEAFQEWGPDDSIYGAKNLAKKWHDEDFLKQIDLLVLLDLIGAPDPKFFSFFSNTDDWYARLIIAEERLALGNYLENYTTSSAVRSTQQRYFQQYSARGAVEDDHIPFLQKGVPILHVIPMPFPDVWHQMTDNHDVIDYRTVENINKILRIFVLEYLNVDL